MKKVVPKSARREANRGTEIPALVKLRWQQISREIDREFSEKIRGVRKDLRTGLQFQDRRVLVAEAIRKKITERISLEKSQHAALGITVSDDRWEEVVAELKTMVDESMIDFGTTLPVRFFPTGDLDPQVIANLRGEAKVIRSALQRDAEREIEIARREARLQADHDPLAQGGRPSIQEWVENPRGSFARWTGGMGLPGKVIGVVALALIGGATIVKCVPMREIYGWLSTRDEPASVAVPPSAIPRREPEIDFDLLQQNSDGTLSLYVSNKGTAHAVVERLEVCGIGEYFLQDYTDEDRRWIRSDSQEGEMEIFGLIGARTSSRWIASCRDKARFPKLLSGSISIAQDSAETLTFGAVGDLELSSNVRTGQSLGMGFCSLTIHFNNTQASRAVMCRERAP